MNLHDRRDVRDRPIARSLQPPDAHRAFRLENLECSLASDAAAVEAKLARVDAALSELER